MSTGKVRGVVGVRGVDFSTPLSSALIRSFGQYGMKKRTVAENVLTSEFPNPIACWPARYPTSCSFSASKFPLKNAKIISLTANTKARKQAAYFSKVARCTRLLALSERIGLRLYGHHSVAAFSSVAYKIPYKFRK